MNNDSGNNSSKPSGGSSGNATGNKNGGVQSKYAIVKEGWGSRPNFQASYGLGSMMAIPTAPEEWHANGR